MSVGVAADWHRDVAALLQGEVDLVGEAGGDQLPSRNALLHRVGRALPVDTYGMYRARRLGR